MPNTSSHYIDGFIFPLPSVYVEEYAQIAVQVAAIWKEYGALAYYEFIGDDLRLEGTRSFVDAADAQDGEVVVFGWVVFPSKEVRDSANGQVPLDERMANLVAPLCLPERKIFDASRMVYGGFRTLVQLDGE